MKWEWKFRPYLSVAEKRRRSQKSTNALQKKGQKLSPVRIEGRMIARSFWGKAWCTNLESYIDYTNRLPRGRSYVRNGSVIDLRIDPSAVNALISGTELYKVKITIEAVKPAAWKRLKKECAGRVGSLLDLLQGKLSGQVMEIITRCETGLFPKPAEIKFDCSCPDWAGMCKHVAAALYGVGARLDENPELLFLLRGADHLTLISEATKNVTTNVSASLNGAVTLENDRLEEVFGIEIDPPVLQVTPTKMAKKAGDRKQAFLQRPGSRPVSGRNTKSMRIAKNELQWKSL